MAYQKKRDSIYEDMSSAEAIVADFLTNELDLWWNFEQPIYVEDNKKRPRVWTPDFYLPELGIYIEVCGKERDCYAFRKKVYDKNRIPVIFVHTYKRDKWRDYLLNEITIIHSKRWELIKRYH